MSPGSTSFLSLLVIAAVVVPLSANSYLVRHVTSSQQSCVEQTRRPTWDCRWYAGLNLGVDQLILSGNVVAYQIQWFNGRWSGWYVPGVNDLDHKINPFDRSCAVPIVANSMRRVWSYFYDHNHRYILCRRP